MRLELGLVWFKYPLALYPWCQGLFKRGLRFRSSSHPLEKPEVFLSQICLRLKTCRPMTDPEASRGIRGKSFGIQSRDSGFSPAAIWPETASSPSKSNETIPWQSPWPLVSLVCVSSVTHNLQRVFRRIFYTNGRSLCQAFLAETVETGNTKLDATHVLLRKLRKD